MADFKTLLHEASERYESACRIMIRITCQTAKLLKSCDFGAPNRWFDKLIRNAPKLPEAVGPSLYKSLFSFFWRTKNILITL